MPAPAAPVVYDSAVEGIFLRGLGDRITPSLKAKLRQLGLDLDQRLRPAYPRDLWVKALALAVAEVFPGMTKEEGYYRLGELAIYGIGNTMLGRTIVSMAKLLGPRRALLRLPQGFTSVNNFMKMELEERAPNYFRVYLNETYGNPAYVRGALMAAMNIAGAKDPQAVIVEAKGDGVSVDVRWEQ